ncbi:SDR family oxidoreductase [uncultured Shewanella sp.]|uniref:SDR family NAD(P)-dependent oxidoreductase n=1 Tax=uncultured Shewanella sp. TaxID=173975 RepID=UPI0026089045|nr:SDR family oxidoreductase [uncultured Shewanella sp.]
MNQTKTLDNLVALVTGGNGGLGLGMAIALKAAGAKVIICARDVRKLKQVEKQYGFTTFMLDVADEVAVAAMFQQIATQFGTLDIVINNAGIYEDQVITSLSREDWDSMIASNLTSAFLCCKHAAGLMKHQKSGKIINIGSMYSLFGHPNSVGYTTTKTALLGLTRALAAELGQWNITVNAILPGWFATAINGDLPQTQRGAQIRDRTPLGRWGKVDDIHQLAVFLSSKGADFITGACIPLDGGYSVSERNLYFE